MPMRKNQNPENKKVTIVAEFPVPLGELAIYALPKKEDKSKIFDLLTTKPQIANYAVGKITRAILRKKKVEVKLKNLEHYYNDSQNLTHGVAYFKVTLEGTENALRKIAGSNKLFVFDWPHQQGE